MAIINERSDLKLADDFYRRSVKISRANSRGRRENRYGHAEAISLLRLRPILP